MARKKKKQLGDCEDCGRNTYRIKEYYMVLNEVWNRVMHPDGGMLCIGCLEKRLKRKLTFRDFLFCPLNIINWLNKSERSARLFRRMTI